jgi:hypothetical protein
VENPDMAINPTAVSFRRIRAVTEKHRIAEIAMTKAKQEIRVKEAIAEAQATDPMCVESFVNQIHRSTKAKNKTD